MPLCAIYAQIARSDLSANRNWFARRFDRTPDAEPMPGLREWRHEAAGLQLFENPEAAWHGVLTLIVSGPDDERARLGAACLAPGPIEEAQFARLVRLSDPDGNLVVLAEPRA